MIGAQQAQRRYRSDRVARVIFFMCAALLIVVIVSVFIFVGANALRIFFDPGGATFQGYFFNTTWDPGANLTDTPQYGAAGLIVGSLVITFCAALIATPLAIGVALYFTEVAPRRIVRFFQPLLEIFVGMPSVVIGFIGLVVLVPFLTKLASGVTGGNAAGGFGWGAAILVLVVMIVPTISSISIDALRAVPQSVREASLALGSTRWQMMSRAVIPAALPMLATAVVFGLARAIGETLAVAMVLGGSDKLPQTLLSLESFFQPNANITQTILNEFPETFGVEREAYWMLAFVLLVISFLFVVISRYFAGRRVQN
ncbi:MAG TPA: phosphate ABC transporter permease subunit PstC [Ktedonobacteraceae bacterium]|nr:phosphate ABC transporter permease subunit PstC [Ktedonobacteraceae bacterium]